MTGPAADVLIVIVNYRSADLAVACLESLEPEVHGRPGTHVALVENASGADQWDHLGGAIAQRGWSSWVTLLASGRNGGFAAGNNVALRWALDWPEPPQVFWLLNPDTLVHPGGLIGLLAVLDAHPEVGIVGSRLEDPDGTLQFSAFRFPSVLGELEGGLRLGAVTRWLGDRNVLRDAGHRSERVDWVSGASLVVRRAVLEQIGLLDEGFFMYYEEVDLCRRATRAGWHCWLAAESRVVHLIGQSGADANLQVHRRRRPRYWFEARNRYYVKHFGRFRARLADLLHWSGFATYRLRRRLQRKPDTDPPGLLWDFLRYSLLAVKR